ncbi:hypothetical protein [Sphingomonas sp. LT1P40]
MTPRGPSHFPRTRTLLRAACVAIVAPFLVIIMLLAIFGARR